MSYVKRQLDWQDTSNENYFVRHWRGHLPLPISYWVNGLAIPLALNFAILAGLTQLARSELELQSLAALDLTYLLFSAVLWIWSIVGIWRSAGFHEERGGSAGWASVARAVVFFGALGAFLQSHDRFLYLLEQGRLAVGNDPVGSPAKIEIEQEGKVALLDGNITSGTAARFRDFVNSHPKVTDLVLRSNGGRTLEADRMAKLIRRRGLNTEAREFCMSACTLLLLAGRERAAGSATRVGFHQPSFPGLAPNEQRVLTDDLRKLYVSAGVDSAFLDKALSVSPESMWFPSVDELMAANVITTSPIVVRARSKAETRMRDQQLQRYLDYTAREISAASPVKLDELTTRTGAQATPRVLTIRFRLGTKKSQVDRGLAIRKMTPILTKQVCDDLKPKLAIRAGATFVFSYTDIGGNPVFDVPISSCEGN